MGRILKKLKKIVFNMCSTHIANELYLYKNNYFSNISFSQEGEDLVLARFLEKKEGSGFYVDIGAHHPLRFSNTYKFYLRGWRGINVDAMPGSMTPFNEIRPNDINLEIAVSDSLQMLTYYIFNEPALNTLSHEEAIKVSGEDSYRIIDTKNIQTRSMLDILDSYLPKSQKIDFMTIDVEGLDLSVIRSNDWDKYRPDFLLVESLRETISDIEKNEIYIYLRSKGYSMVAKTYNTMFFKNGTN